MKILKQEAWLLFKFLSNDRPALITVLFLGIGVVFVVVLHVLTSIHAISFLSMITGETDWDLITKLHYDINLSRDRSLGEIVGYGIAFLASTMFLLAFFDIRSPILLFFSALMAFVWFDDAAGYHERFGRLLVGAFDLQAAPGLRPQDTGEVLAWSLAGLMLLVLLLLSLVRRRPGDIGALAFVSCGFGLLVVCGVLADLAHVAVPAPFGSIFSIIEDGGEMVAIVWIAGVALGLARSGRNYYEAARSQAAAGPQM